MGKFSMFTRDRRLIVQPKQKQSLSHLQKLLHRLKALFRSRAEPEAEPGDPYAYRTAPLRRPPNTRTGAAVVELDEQ